MSRVTELEQKIEREKRNVLKETYLLEDEIEQLRQDKFSYKRKGDYYSLEKANAKEKELEHKLNSIKSRIPSLEAQLKRAKDEEKRANDQVERKRKQRQKQQETRSQMNNVLRVMRQGKTRSQAAQTLDIPLSRINHWYREGVVGTTKDTSHFYREVKSIEDDRERRERERIKRQKRIDQERRERNARQERLRKQREHERKSNVKNSSPKSNNERLMDEILSLMRKGSSRSEAANRLNVNIATVNNWYNRGKRGESDYQNFYNKVKSIEDVRNKYNPTFKPKSNLSTKQSSKPKVEPKNKKTTKLATSSKYVRCPKCGKQYNKHINSQCPHCKKSNTLTKAKYCQKCGKKLDNNEVNYCTKCGASINTGKKTYGKKTTTSTTISSNNDSSDWIVCCVAIFVIFIIMAFLGMLI